MGTGEGLGTPGSYKDAVYDSNAGGNFKERKKAEADVAATAAYLLTYGGSFVPHPYVAIPCAAANITLDLTVSEHIMIPQQVKLVMAAVSLAYGGFANALSKGNTVKLVRPTNPLRTSTYVPPQVLVHATTSKGWQATAYSEFALTGYNGGSYFWSAFDNTPNTNNNSSKSTPAATSSEAPWWWCQGNSLALRFMIWGSCSKIQGKGMEPFDGSLPFLCAT